eukprot:PhF_6_TR1406/c0_g1_i1/m.2443
MEENESSPLSMDIPTEEFCFDIALHPHLNITVAGMVSGDVHVIGYDQLQWRRITTISSHHKTAVRSVLFSSDGCVMFTGSSDKTVQCYDVQNQSSVWQTKKRHHKAPINAVCLIEEGNLIAAGDDTGLINLFDMRAGGNPVQSYDEHGDFVTGFTLAPPGTRLVSSSGDGTIGIYDVRRGRVLAFPKVPSRNDEMLCIDMCQHSNRVVCGSSKGHLYSWDIDDMEKLDLYHKLKGNVKEVSKIVMLKNTQDIHLDVAMTGARDGVIRSLVVTPHEERLVGVVGDVGEGSVECLAVCPRTGLILAASEEFLRWYDISAYMDPAKLKTMIDNALRIDNPTVGESSYEGGNR